MEKTMKLSEVIEMCNDIIEGKYATQEEITEVLDNIRVVNYITLMEKYEKNKDEKTAREIDILIKGMFLLQDVGTVEGFIARGVADDGKAHYPFSSEDQFTPFVIALYSYYKSDLCKDGRSRFSGDGCGFLHP